MTDLAASRAEWFARLAGAIDEAQEIAWQLRTEESASKEARRLYGRLEAARAELESIRRLVTPQQPLPDPDWVATLGWGLGPADTPD